MQSVLRALVVSVARRVHRLSSKCEDQRAPKADCRLVICCKLDASETGVGDRAGADERVGVAEQAAERRAKESCEHEFLSSSDFAKLR